jgi:hypothetical protein
MKFIKLFQCTLLKLVNLLIEVNNQAHIAFSLLTSRLIEAVKWSISNHLLLKEGIKCMYYLIIQLKRTMLSTLLSTITNYTEPRFPCR